MVAITISRTRVSVCWGCIGLLVGVVIFLCDELIMVHLSFGQRRGVSCPDGKLTGGGSQVVCIKDDSVVKVYRPCDNGGKDRGIGGLIGCKLNYWHQRYVNDRWEMYAESPLVPNVLSRDGSSGMVFERIHLAGESGDVTDVTPDYEWNMEQLHIFDAMLRENGHIATDLAPSNAPMDESGRIRLVDFMLLPAWMGGIFGSRRGPLRSHYQRRERLPLFLNLYGKVSVLDRVVEGGVDSELVRRAIKDEKGGIGRGLREGRSLD